MPRLLSLALLLISVCCISPVQARSLYWEEMAVKARLDGQGVLHVREEQTMVFSGAWNGGERRFQVRPGQRLVLNGVSRRDPVSGRTIPLVHGGLEQVDHWSWAGGNLLRWRSRLPSDPPFNQTRLTYILDYTLQGVLVPRQGRYRLDHDFCFPNRAGVIRRFSLELTLDPVWQGGGVIRHVASQVPPGQGVVLHRLLEYTGDNPGAIATWHPPAPAPVAPPVQAAPAWLRYLLVALVWSFLVVLLLRLVRHERNLDRFAPMPDTATIDRAWLEEHLFSLLPEVVGATWDKDAGSSEVAAILARMIQEGKLASRVEPKVYRFFGLEIKAPPASAILHLALLVPRSSLTGYERALVDEFFVDGSDVTDTETIRSHYRKKGNGAFDPVSLVRKPLSKRMREMTEGEGTSSLWFWVPSALLAVTGFFLLLFNSVLHQVEFFTGLMAILAMVFFWVIGLYFASSYRLAVDRLVPRLLAMAAMMLLVALVYSVVCLRFAGSDLLLVAMFFFALAMLHNLTGIARSRDTVQGMRLRRQLGAARRYFVRELKKERPNLEDAWFPYLVAFGLAPEVDSWFRNHGESVMHHMTTVPGGHVSGPLFTGGGGQFGGGGAAGYWSSAVDYVASGMPSSSGSSGFSGGGGSSGGGGGGGW